MRTPPPRAREILAEGADARQRRAAGGLADQRAIEVVYGSDVKGRGIEESAPLGVSAAAELLKDGKLMDGLIKAVQVMSAGVSPR